MQHVKMVGGATIVHLNVTVTIPAMISQVLAKVTKIHICGMKDSEFDLSINLQKASCDKHLKCVCWYCFCISYNSNMTMNNISETCFRAFKGSVMS